MLNKLERTEGPRLYTIQLEICLVILYTEPNLQVPSPEKRQSELWINLLHSIYFDYF